MFKETTHDSMQNDASTSFKNDIKQKMKINSHNFDG